MGEIFWRQMYREARKGTQWWISIVIGQGVVIAALVAALISCLR